jgi:protein-S-isoprenylcysteine O-methyltransferase Ste14
LFIYLYITFVLAALVNRALVTRRVLKMDKVKGVVQKAWITKLVFIFYFVVFAAPTVELLLVDRKINYLVSGVAAACYLAGMALWLWAVRNLRRYWSTDIEIREEHPLIKTGPYRYLRHPHYLFIFLELFGLPLIANAYYSLILIAAIYVPLIALRIYYEEKALVKKFGNAYLEYKTEVWGLFPLPIFKKGVRG